MKKELSLSEQIKIALDGRPQRWLSVRMFIGEIDLSRKMNGVLEFSEEDIEKINKVLKCQIKSSLSLKKSA